MKEFINIENTKLLRGPYWIHDYENDIGFSYLFWPNGRYPHCKGSISWLLQIGFDNDKISKVTTSYSLYCKQFKDGDKYKYEYKEEKRVFGMRGDAYGIHNNQSKLTLDDCKQYDIVEFCCDVQILDIQFKTP